jgi:hypothetical protein
MASTLAICVVGAQASITSIAIGNDYTISGDIDKGKAETGYVNNGAGGASYEHVYAGAFYVNAVPNPNSGAFPEDPLFFYTFCTDVGVNWKSSDTYTAVQFGDAGNGVNPDWTTMPGAIQNASYLYNQNIGSVTSAAQYAGLQLAIWKVLYDTASDGTIANTSGTSADLFANGNLLAKSFSSTAMDDALNYVKSINTARGDNTFLTYNDTWLKPDDSASQGLLYNNLTTPVPEPTTVLAGVLLLLPFGLSTLRMVRRNRVV